jgi:hypothetical protein
MGVGVGRPASKMAHLHGCWQEVSGPGHSGLSLGVSEYTHAMSSGFLQSDWSKTKKQGGNRKIFYDLVWKNIHCHWCHVQFIKFESPGPA